MLQADRHVISPWPMPAAWRCASLSRPCEVLAGCETNVLTSPRLVHRVAVRTVSSTAKARARAWSGSALRTSNDNTAPPCPDCCAIASSCCGWLRSAG